MNSSIQFRYDKIAIQRGHFFNVIVPHHNFVSSVKRVDDSYITASFKMLIANILSSFIQLQVEDPFKLRFSLLTLYM